MTVTHPTSWTRTPLRPAGPPPPVANQPPRGFFGRHRRAATISAAVLAAIALVATGAALNGARTVTKTKVVTDTTAVAALRGQVSSLQAQLGVTNRQVAQLQPQLNAANQRVGQL